eukprot:g1069.t1
MSRIESKYENVDTDAGDRLTKSEKESKTSESSGGLWQDEEFPSEEASLGESLRNLAESKEIAWLRPSEFVPKESAPLIFDEAQGSGQVVRGDALNGAGFLGALSAIAAHPNDLLESLFCEGSEDFLKTGKIVVQLYNGASWERISIDTCIPCDARTRRPLFGHSRNLNELWVVFLEKAYAKMRRGYANTVSNDFNSMLVTLTGGSSRGIDIQSAAGDNGGEEFWDTIRDLFESDCVIGCANYQSKTNHSTYSSSNTSAESKQPVPTKVRDGKGAEDDLAEDEVQDGVLKNRVYSIVYCKQIGDQRFVKLRDVWTKDGNGWKGDWSSESELWDEHPDVTRAMLEDEFAEFTRECDGTFWMHFDDFVSEFREMHVCQIFSNSQRQYLLRGAWKAKSAGGAHLDLSKRVLDLKKDARDRDVRRTVRSRNEPAESQDGRWKRWIDGDPSWFNNPQYRIQIASDEHTPSSASTKTRDAERKRKVRICVSLVQLGRRDDDDKTVQIDFVIIRKPLTWSSRVWELNTKEVVAQASCPRLRSSLSENAQREVSCDGVEISSSFAYFLVPFTVTRGVQSSFALRVFSEESARLDVRYVEETHSVVEQGAWVLKRGELETAGGPLEGKNQKMNSQWCQNPQYALYIPPWRTERTTVKIVVKRVQSSPRDRKSKWSKIGVCVTRPDMSNRTNVRRQRARAPTKRALLSEESLDSLESSTLNRTQRAEISSAGGIVEIDRKSQIQRDEWTVVSSFVNTSEATLLLRDLSATFCERGLIVVPMLRREEQGQFHVEVHADLPIKMQRLSEVRSRSLSGRWGHEMAGGCHASVDDDTWLTKNPKFSLRLHGSRGESTKVEVCLSRSRERWATAAAKDPIASMMGFYIVPPGKSKLELRKELRKNGMVFQTQFVPMSKLSTPEGFELKTLDESEEYLIVPSTYGTGQNGPFSLTIKSDVEFSFFQKF